MYQDQEQQNMERAAEQEQEQCSSWENQNDYGSAYYWEKRYLRTRNQRFDWLEDYKSLKNIIMRELNSDKNKLILNVGCGNATIQDELYRDGYRNIVNNDISHFVIEQMNENKNKKGYKFMTFQVMDITAMTYPTHKFDMVLDKSTLDTLLCSESPSFKAAKMLAEVSRILKNDGVYLMISYSEPAYRLLHLQREHVNFSVQIETIEKMDLDGHKIIHYVYICRKKKLSRVMTQEQINLLYLRMKEIDKREGEEKVECECEGEGQQAMEGIGTFSVQIGGEQNNI